MSIARHHAEWLSLVPVSGPFLSLPVLMEAFNTGLEPHDSEQSRLLRQEYGNWLESFENRKADPAPHQHWIKFVLNNTLDLDDRALIEGQAIPQSLQVEVPEHHELLRPSIVLIDPNTQKPRLLIQTYPRAQGLTSYVVNSRWKASPDTRMTELLHATGVRLGLVTNGEHWMLVDAPKGETTGYASWYASLWLEEPITLRAFRSLLSASRFFNVPDDQTLEALFTKSASNQQEVTEQLGYQVRRAVEVLIHSLDRADQDFGRELLEGVAEAVLYESALTVMMRLVFLFCAEERELIPSKPFPVYEQNYSVSTISRQLRDLADQHGEELLERRYDAWPRLLAAFRAVYGGLKHDDVHIPAYGGSLFNPDRFPFLEGRKQGTSWRDAEASPLPVNNRTVLHLLEALQLLQIKVPGGGPAEARRLSFRALDIEQIGHVYEGLLDHTAKRADEPYLGLAGTRDKEPEIPLAELEKLLAKGESDLFKFLKEETGKSEKALQKSLKVDHGAQDASRYRTACQSDDALWKRVMPFAGFVRSDNFGYPMVIPARSIFVTAGTDRRSSGTHYTPRSLTEPIVQYTLEPLVYVGPAEGEPKDKWNLKSAKELLELKICDMACGSGAFLVQAARYMAERLLEAWDDAKKAHPNTPGITPEGTPSTGNPNESLIPDDPAERKTYAMRIIAQRCLYGVDKNPLAAEMAKLSLWLLTLAKDKPFEFLDHSIRCGDSLVGLNSIDQLRHFSLEPNDLDQPMFSGPWLDGVPDAIDLRLKLEGMPANTVEDIQLQEKLLAEANEKIARLRCAADLLVAAEFWGAGAKDKLARVQHAAKKSDYYVEKGPTEEFEQVAAKERRGQIMFHWPIEFPEVILKRGGFDSFIGNPPFMHGSRIATELGTNYSGYLRAVHPNVHGKVNLVAFFMRNCTNRLNLKSACGLIVPDSIVEGADRIAGPAFLEEYGMAFYQVHTRIPWPGDANLFVARFTCCRGPYKGQSYLNERPTEHITSRFTSERDLGSPFSLKEANGLAFLGVKPDAPGFFVATAEAENMLRENPSFSTVLKPYLNGVDLNAYPELKPGRYVIDFTGLSLEEAARYDVLLDHLKRTVKPGCTWRRWWQFNRPAAALAKAVAGMTTFIASARVTKHLAFQFVPAHFVYSDKVVAFGRSDWTTFSMLSSTLHGVWATALGTRSMAGTFNYQPTECVQTMAFLYEEADHSQVECGREYYEYRQQLMKNRSEGLTDTYNRFHAPLEANADIRKLRELHIEIDFSVAAAYSWNDLDLDHGFHETKQGIRFTISEPARREILQRLLQLNHERYDEEVKQGLHKKKTGKSTAIKPKSAAKGHKQSTLFDDDATFPSMERDNYLCDPDCNDGYDSTGLSGFEKCLSCDGDGWCYYCPDCQFLGDYESDDN